jgi:predicted  nucleic acid-binding Zn-ribbon protein
MASPELQRLWKLAQVDNAIESIKKRAAALDPGKKILAELQALEKQDAEIGGKSKALRSELADLELKQKGSQDKIKKFDKELYGGKVVNPREVENIEREIASLKRQVASHDERIMELWELIPPAEKDAEAIAAQIEEKKKQFAERRKQAMIEKEQLEAEYKKYAAARPKLAEEVRNPGLLARYDGIRQRHGSGMTEITKTGHCGACGTHLPERTLQMLKDDKAATCESCHRLLYYSEGVI